MTAAGLPSSRRYAVWLAALRIYVGLFWLQHGVQKLLDPHFAGRHGFMVAMVNRFAANTTGWYHHFLTATVLTHPALFAGLVEWGETLVGVSLLLGLLTRLGGSVGTLLAINYFAATGKYAALDDYTGYAILAAILSFVNVALPTGRLFGIDGTIGVRRR